MDWEAAARAFKDVMGWSGSYLPLSLGWVLLGIGVVLAIGYLMKAWRGK